MCESEQMRGKSPSLSGSPGASSGSPLPRPSPARKRAREVAIVALGTLCVGAMLAALIRRVYLDHQHREAQTALKREAWATKEAADELLERAEYVQAREKYLAAQSELDALDVADSRLRRALEIALESDDIRYRSRGMVVFRGRWVTAHERQAILAEEQGLVKFRGRWMKEEAKESMLASERLEEKRRRAELEEKRRRAEEERRTGVYSMEFVGFVEAKNWDPDAETDGIQFILSFRNRSGEEIRATGGSLMFSLVERPLFGTERVYMQWGPITVRESDFKESVFTGPTYESKLDWSAEPPSASVYILHCRYTSRTGFVVECRDLVSGIGYP